MIVSRHEGRFVVLMQHSARGNVWIALEHALSGITVADVNVVLWVLCGDGAPRVGELRYYDAEQLRGTEFAIRRVTTLDELIDENAFAAWMDGRDAEPAESEAA